MNFVHNFDLAYKEIRKYEKYNKMLAEGCQTFVDQRPPQLLFLLFPQWHPFKITL